MAIHETVPELGQGNKQPHSDAVFRQKLKALMNSRKGTGAHIQCPHLHNGGHLLEGGMGLLRCARVLP